MPFCEFGQPITLGEKRLLQPGRLLWLRAIAWMVFSIFVVALAFGVTTDAVSKVMPTGGGFASFAARCIGPFVGLAVYALLVRFGEARDSVELAAHPALPQLMAGMVLGALMFSLVMLILVVGGLYEVRIVGWSPAWLPGGAAVEAAVIEEIMVRGLMLRLTWRAFGPAVAFLVSAVAFGVGHVGNDNATAFAVLCIALEAGIMLGAFYALTGRLWVSIGVHIAWNFTQGYVFGAAVSGQSLGPSLAKSTARVGLPDWLTGGPFGPEASMAALIVCSAVGAIALKLAWMWGRFKRQGVEHTN